jgi:type II secretory pathway pseudopilin PulG
MIELLVILAILGFLLALLLPSVQKVREAAGRTHTLNNLKQIGLAIHNYVDVFKRLPPAFDKLGNQPQAFSIHVHLLPFMEQDQIYKRYLDGKGDDEAVIGAFASPTDPSHPNPPAGIQNSAANLRVFSTKGQQTQLDAPMPALGKVEPLNAINLVQAMPDGTSNTIIFATRYGVCGDGGSRYASAPNTNTAALFGQNPAKVKAAPADMTATFLLHPSAKECRPTPLMGHAFSVATIEVEMGDGSARSVTARISVQTWNAAVQPNDGGVLGADWLD